MPRINKITESEYPSADAILQAVTIEYKQDDDTRKDFDRRATTLLGFVGVATGALLGLIKVSSKDVPLSVLLLFLAAIAFLAVASWFLVSAISCRQFSRIALDNIIAKNNHDMPENETKSRLASTYVDAIKKNKKPMESKANQLTRGIWFLMMAVLFIFLGAVFWAVGSYTYQHNKEIVTMSKNAVGNRGKDNNSNNKSVTKEGSKQSDKPQSFGTEPVRRDAKEGTSKK